MANIGINFGYNNITVTIRRDNTDRSVAEIEDGFDTLTYGQLIELLDDTNILRNKIVKIITKREKKSQL